MDGTVWVIPGVLLADSPKWALFWWSLALAGTLLLGAMILLVVERYRKRAANRDVSAGDQLTHFRELYNQGSISKEEFEKIRSQLAGDLRKELNLGPSPASAPTHLGDSPTVPEPPPNGSPPAP